MTRPTDSRRQGHLQYQGYKRLIVPYGFWPGACLSGCFVVGTPWPAERKIGMIGRLKDDWRYFKDGVPGERFEERYKHRQKIRRSWWSPVRLFNIIVGTILVVGSAAFGWAPGPGMLTFVIGLGMIAGEFRFAARFLDWAEIKTRKLWNFVTWLWNSSVFGKALVVAVALVLVASTAYGVYFVFFSG